MRIPTQYSSECSYSACYGKLSYITPLPILSLFIVSNPSFFRSSSVSNSSVHLLRPSGDSVHACDIISASCNSRVFLGLTGSGFLRQGALETFFTISLLNIGNSCSADSQRIFYLHFRCSVIDHKQKMCQGQFSRSFTPPFHEIVEILYFFFRKFLFFP